MRSKLQVLALLVALVAAACGSRLPDDVLESVDAGRAGPAEQSGPATTPGTGQASAPGTGGDGDVAAGSELDGGPSSGPVEGSGEPAVETGGESTGGGGDDAPTRGGSGGEGSGSDCASLPDADGTPGVTDEEIKVGAIVTDSGPLPGATEGSYRAAAARAAMVNAQGGICGRKLTVLKGDDGLDPSRARAEFQRLEPEVFAFVGSFAVADSGYVDLIESTGVPYVSLVVDPAGREAPNVWPRTATDRVDTGPFIWLKDQHPDVERAAILFANVGGVSTNVPGFNEAVKRAGFDLAYTDPVDVTSPDYTAEVRKAQDEGIEFLFLFAFEINMHVRFVRAMNQQGYDPPIKFANIAYNSRFSEILGEDGDGWLNYTTHALFLDPSERQLSQDVADFLDWNERMFPGGQLDLFPVYGWGRTSFFVKAMRGLEGEISRRSLLDSMARLDIYEGGGIERPVDPSNGIGEPCFNVAVHDGGQWLREFPDGRIFECEIGELYKWE